ncbi:hypothetical protein CLV92_10627 [Kineococcus xinjiangensis]|uniref:Uncharacterized protein n=1 Tax=Kineococcus xinjiangensis TaxID=512762 RepID=A0A2S6IM05_9ACTN|nr:hypothetical protein [Kineococcus xinjiangensis]PPK95206.1 hypothetical protein CLV92_10627 [Kineococcus xinjiangensis]
MTGGGEAAEPSRSVLVVPVEGAERLSAVCTLARVRGRVVPVEGAGCVLLPAAPADAEAAAAKLSTLVQGADVVVLTSAAGAVTAQRWRGGRRQEDPKAGLLLSVWPDAVQRLLLGRLDPAEVPGTRDGGEGPRWRAAWSLARSRRRG